MNEGSKKFKSGGHSLINTGKPRKTCAEMAGRRTFRILTVTVDPMPAILKR
jgi:hypothetical protein